ncbi:MAG TPA: TlpA disulfide reductase family protein [Candidatus Limnocylindrales bacterium]|nr:TlpA disulfide reductase family protein [Candidatus Limnocylindrales bacterium]
MMLRFVLVAFVALISSAAAAALKLDSLSVGPVTYTNVTILGANTTDLYFTHALGIANVKLKYLTPEMQKRFNYDPKAAAEAEKKQNESDMLYQATEASAFYSHGQKVADAVDKPRTSSEDNLADPISERSLLGRHAPEFEADSWLGEKPSLEGKFVLVAFWAPWSIPCRKCVPELNALQKRFKDKLAVVGWTSDGELANVNEFKMEFPSALDSKSKLSALCGVTSIPFVLLLDNKHIIRYQGHPAAVTEKKLEALMSKAEEQSK